MHHHELLRSLMANLRHLSTEADRSLPGYGAFMGKIDVDRMDLIKCGPHPKAFEALNQGCVQVSGLGRR